jgi:hypothetical protein
MGELGTIVVGVEAGVGSEVDIVWRRMGDDCGRESSDDCVST